MHFATIARILGVVLVATAATMLIPLAIAIWQRDVAQVLAFGLTALAVTFVGGAITLTIPGRVAPDVTRDAIAVLAGFWLIVPACAAIPFYWSSSLPTFASAYFEAVSGLTTTGATVYRELADVPTSLIFWRAFLHWIGGLATIVSVAMVLAPTRRNEHPGYGALKLGHMAHKDGWFPRALATVLLPMYAGLTVLTFLLLRAAGIPSFDAICLAFSAISTGGFMPRDGTLELYGAPLAPLVLGFAMLTGAISLLWLNALARFQWRDVLSFREPLYVVAVLGLLTALLAWRLDTAMPDTGLTDWASDTVAAFGAAASIISTTGLPISHRVHELVPMLVLLGLTFLGAGRFSTAGGLKYFRLGTMLRQCDAELRKLVYPNSIQPGDERRGRVAADLIAAVWANFAVAAMAVILVAIVCAADGQSLSGGLIAAVAAISNAGPVFSLATIDGVYGAAHYSDFSDPTKVILGLAMVLGRFEILALLSLLNAIDWRSP